MATGNVNLLNLLRDVAEVHSFWFMSALHLVELTRFTSIEDFQRAIIHEINFTTLMHVITM